MSENESATDRPGAVPDGSADIGSAIALAVLVLAIPAVIIGLILFVLIPGPWWLGIVLGLAAAGIAVWLQVRRADQVVLSRLGGGLLQPDGAARLENLVQGLSLAGGVEEPEIVVLSDQSRNAMAVRNQDRNRVVLTQGLVESLEVVELEGVVAELLTRLKNGDAASATLGAALFGIPILDGPLAPVLRPVANVGLSRLLRADRDLEADRQAVRLTRYPPGLHGALRKMSQGDVTPNALTAGQGHLWLIEPSSEHDMVETGTRAPLDLRIDVLAEL